MKTYIQFITEVYDKDVMDRSQISKTGEVDVWVLIEEKVNLNAAE